MRDDAERLRDLLEAANKIAERVERGRDQFDRNEDVQLALVRLIEIIGEACAHLSEELRRRHPDAAWRAAAAMRNRVIHRYFDIDADLVWTAAAHEIPALAEAARGALEDLDVTNED